MKICFQNNQKKTCFSGIYKIICKKKKSRSVFLFLQICFLLFFFSSREAKVANFIIFYLLFKLQY